MVDEKETFAVAERLKVVLTVMLVSTLVLVAAIAVSRTSNQAEIVAVAAGQIDWQRLPLQPGQELALAVIGFVHLAFGIALLLNAPRVVGNFGKGEPTYAAASARTLRRLLWAPLFVWVIVAGAIGSVILSSHMPVGERTLVIGQNSTQISLALAALIAGFMLKTFALCAELGQDYKEEAI